MKLWSFQALNNKDRLHHPATVCNVASLIILFLVIVLAVYYAPELEKEQGRDLAVDIGTIITPKKVKKEISAVPENMTTPAPSSQKSSQ